MANKYFNKYAVGKKVYYINGQRFYNDKNQHNGLSRATNYCLDNALDTNDIIQFDSDTETDYYEILMARQQRGEISGLKHHYLHRVQDEFVNANGDVIPEITYNADFRYHDNQADKDVVVDVKSSEYFLNNDSGRFILLKSVFDKRFLENNLYIMIVIKKSDGTFYEWHIGDKQKSGKLIKKQSEKIKQLKAEAHKREVEDRKAEREKERLVELLKLQTAGVKLTKAQRDRLEALQSKYEIGV